MDFLRVFLQYSRVRELVRGVSARTGVWWRRIFYSRLINFIHQVKVDYWQEFARLAPEDAPFMRGLKEGNVFLLKGFISGHLSFENPGRFVVAVAFLGYVFDQWDRSNTVFSADFLLEFVSVELWLAVRRYYTQMMDVRAAQLMTELANQEEEETWEDAPVEIDGRE
ncbi:E1B 19K [Polar bear adenovirus 1]|uniref:E1B protein, small T-antigen n=1 Tax=Polar bear adenovirus 1 TaxID=2250215 RepID=A0A2Z4QJM3_9ADEN|nr:E1B 19K [Polar bear adenovirus 1]AWY10559.1 E1B 19K [Polar bear adenovirus 1]AXI68647.1 E1B 19K [Polar bear adenovirus 1]